MRVSDASIPDLEPGEKKVNALSVSQTHQEQYHATSEAVLQGYVDDLQEAKQDKLQGRRVTAKSKVMDVHHTFAEVQTIVRIPSSISSILSTHVMTQLTNLNARVGIRALVLMVRASNNYNQVPLSFATDAAAASFLQKVYSIDIHDLLTKFEGYSIAGGTLAGASSILPAMFTSTHGC